MLLEHWIAQVPLEQAPNYLSIAAALLVTLTSLVLFVTTDWRQSILLLSLQYVGVFILVADHWPPGMAATKLIAGWISGAVLGLAISGLPELQRQIGAGQWQNRLEQPLHSGQNPPPEARAERGHAFYVLAALLVGLAVLSRVSHTIDWIPEIPGETVWGGLILISMGLLKLGFTVRPFPLILGLLTTLSGFEILYSVVESSILMAGLLAGVTLMLALVGAYLMMTPYMEESE